MKKLYSYQKRVHTLVLSALNAVGKALMVLAPGLGKTVVSSFLLQSIYKKRNKVLFLCHDNYILEQAHREFRETFDPDGNLIFYDFFGSIKDIQKAKDAHVVFASFQSLNSKSKWYQRFSKNHFSIIFVDEGHHAQAPTFREVINYFNPDKALCMTGTPDRMDELDIRDLYGDEVVNITIEEGIAKGWLTNVEYHVLSDGLNKEALEQMFKEVVVEKRRISLSQINKQLFVKKRDAEQIKEIKKYTENWNKKCIIFCENIHHVRSFAKSLPKGTYCTFHSGNSTKVNNENLHAFKHGDMNVILSVDKFNEGIDIPDVEVIVFIRVTESGTVYRQQLGRGLRKMLGKTKVIVLDFVANTQRILMIQGMVKTIQQFTGPVKSDKSPLSVTGTHYSFNFVDELEDIMEILRVARMGFYETWQEASEAAQKLGIKSKPEYRKRYKEDRKLPIAPESVYPDFPGARVFFGGKDLLSFEELRKEVRKAGIKSSIQYSDYRKTHRKEDWPSRPDHGTYKTEWTNWKDFLFKNYAPQLPFNTLQKEVRDAGIKSVQAYEEVRKNHSGWPGSPNKKYKEWIGWREFLREDFVGFLPFKKLRKEVQSAGILSWDDYMDNFKTHPGWHSNPKKFYENEWISWDDFIGRTGYLTFEKFVKAVRKAGIKTFDEYKQVYKTHPGWHSAPYKFYKDQWTTWPEILGTTGSFGSFLPYEKWVKEVRKAKIKNGKLDYKTRYKNFTGWPATPRSVYKDNFTGWGEVLGNKDEFLIFKQLTLEVRKAKIAGVKDYQSRYKNFTGWPYSPDLVYKSQWKGWSKFLGKK